MPDEPKRRLTAGSDMYHNTAILDRILAIALEAGRKRDIYAVMLTARHGAELGPRYLYARISGSLIERTKPKYRHWVKSLIITKTPQMSDGYTKPISPLAMEDVALWRSQFPNLEHLYWDIDNPHARPYLNKIDINFRSEQSGRRATLRCQTRATVTVCRSRTLYSTFRRPLFKHFDVVSNTMTLTIRHSSGSGIGRSFRTFFAANETLPYAFTVDTLTLECDGSQSGDMVELISIMRHVLGDTRKIHMEGGAALNSIISILDASPSLMELHVEDCRADIGLHNLASVVRAVRTREVAIKRLTLPIIIPRTTAVGPEHPHLREADWSHGPVSDVKLLLYTSSRALRRLPLWIFRLARSLAGLLSPHATFEVLWSDAVIAGGGRVVLHSPLQYLFKAVTLWLQSLTPDMQTLVKQIHPASDHMPVIRGHNDLLLLQRRYGGTVLLPPMQLGTSARAGTRRSAARALTSPRSYSTGTA